MTMFIPSKPDDWVQLPREITEPFWKFLAEHKTGSLVLDVKDGYIKSWKLTEHGHVDRKAPASK